MTSKSKTETYGKTETHGKTETFGETATFLADGKPIHTETLNTLNEYGNNERRTA